AARPFTVRGARDDRARASPRAPPRSDSVGAATDPRRGALSAHVGRIRARAEHVSVDTDRGSGSCALTLHSRRGSEASEMISDEELPHINVLTERIIGCAIEVHRGLGPGLLEQTYEAAMCVELNQWG